MHTVIIVDDDKWALRDIQYSFRFRERGFEVIGAYENAESALEAIRLRPPDLIVSDVCMASASGLDLARSCRDMGLKSIVVIVSGYDRFSYVREALQSGVFDYLLKPLETDQVDILMDKVVKKLEEASPAYTDDTFGQMLQYIHTNYHRSLQLEEVADALFVNRSYLSELFSRRMGMTFTQYKRQLRVQKACKMIAAGASNMTEIAFSCGFDSISSFSKAFKQQEGISPMAYRASLRNEKNANAPANKEEDSSV